MLNWDAVDQDDNEDDFLAEPSNEGEAATPAACPLNPDALGGDCEACQ